MPEPTGVGPLPRYDFHMHSAASSDALPSARAICAAAVRRGLSGIAVTDHDTIRGGLEASAVAPPGLLVIVGAEIYTDAGDLLCLFLSEEVRSRSALDVIAEVHAQGGLVFLPHPMRSHPRPLPDAVLEGCDGYEALNGRAGWFAPDAAGPGGRWPLLAGKARIGSSDAHFAREVGRAWTGIPGPATPENVRRALVAGDTTVDGTIGSSGDWWLSQLLKFVRTGDLRMIRGAGRRLARWARA